MANENNQSIIYEDDEIDLYELWLVIKKRSKLIIAITLIFILAVIIYIFLTPDIYKTSFVLQTESGIVSPFQIKENVNSLNTLIKDKEYLILKQKLQFSKVRTIKKIVSNIPRGEKGLVLVNLELEDTNQIDHFVNKLIDYLNTRPAIEKEVKIQKRQLIATINVLQQQIKNLRNLQQKLNNNSTFINSLSIQIDPLQIALSIQQDKEKIIEAQAELKNLQAVKLAVEPITPKKPYWPKTPLLITVAIIAGIFFSVFLAFFLEWIENAKKRFEEENKNK